MRERRHAAEYRREDSVGLPTVLAGDRYQRTGIALVTHRSPLRIKKNLPALAGGFVGLDVS
jgi:hypothetical protein